MNVAFVYNQAYNNYDYGPAHPLRVSRLPLTVALMEGYGLLKHPDLEYIEGGPATEEEMLTFHRPDYLNALKQANSGREVGPLSRFGLGPGDNPIFKGVYEWARMLAGASLTAARAVADGKAEIAFNIAGGMHHGQPGAASGFCYVNDAVLAIKELLDRGHRVAYVDIDAHHGDGVQDAFYETDRVMTISIHQSGRTLFPGTGEVYEKGRGAGLGYSVNIPLQPKTDDRIFKWAFDQVVPPLLDAYDPDILVTQLGADALYSDPLADLYVTDRIMTHACRYFRGYAGRWVALGGGGYNVVNVARCWTLALATMLGVELESALPEKFKARVKNLEPDRKDLRDSRRELPEDVARSPRDDAGWVIDHLKANLFPLHRI